MKIQVRDFLLLVCFVFVISCFVCVNLMLSTQRMIEKQLSTVVDIMGTTTDRVRTVENLQVVQFKDSLDVWTVLNRMAEDYPPKTKSK